MRKNIFNYNLRSWWQIDYSSDKNAKLQKSRVLLALTDPAGHLQSLCEWLCPSDLGKGSYSLATYVGVQRAMALYRGCLCIELPLQNRLKFIFRLVFILFVYLQPASIAHTKTRYVLMQAINFFCSCYSTVKTWMEESVSEKVNKIIEAPFKYTNKHLVAPYAKDLATGIVTIINMGERVARYGIDQTTRTVQAFVAVFFLSATLPITLEWSNSVDLGVSNRIVIACVQATQVAAAIVLTRLFISTWPKLAFLNRESPRSTSSASPSLLGAQVWAFLNNDNNSLMKAASEGDIQTIIKMQVHGAALEVYDTHGYTPLHYAVLQQRREVIDLFWYYGCNLQPPSNDGEVKLPIHLLTKGSPLYTHIAKLTRTPNRFQLGENPIYAFYPPEGIVFKGGGPKGIAYVGAWKYLQDNNLLSVLHRVAGTSAGAITAAFAAFGYTAKDMQEAICEKDLVDFLDHPLITRLKSTKDLEKIIKNPGSLTLKEIFSSIEAWNDWSNFFQSDNQAERLVKGLRKIVQKGGVCRGDDFREWIDGKIRKKTGKRFYTFGELRKDIAEEKAFKHLHLFTIKMPGNEIVSISSEDPQWDQVIISDAIRASMSIPFAFEPHFLHIKKDGARVKAEQFGQFMDGGMIKNCPIDTFDFQNYFASNPERTAGQTNWQTLAFNLIDSPEEEVLELPEGMRPLNIVAVGNAVFNTYVGAEESCLRSRPDHLCRMVNIDNKGVGLITGFFMGAEDKEKLIESGFEGTKAFFESQREKAEQYKAADPRHLLARTVLSALGLPTDPPPQLEERHVQIQQTVTQHTVIQTQIEENGVVIDDAASQRALSKGFQLLSGKKLSKPTNYYGLLLAPGHFEPGDCLFQAIAMATDTYSGKDLRAYAISDETLQDEELVQGIRAGVGVERLRVFNVQIGDFEELTYQSIQDYKTKMACPKTWGTAIQIATLARFLQRPIYVITQQNQQDDVYGDQQPGAPIFLNYTGDHYELLVIPADRNDRDIARNIDEAIENRRAAAESSIVQSLHRKTTTVSVEHTKVQETFQSTVRETTVAITQETIEDWEQRHLRIMSLIKNS